MNLKEFDDFYSLKGEAECDSCKGTGLYCGFAEKEGSAVVCYHCKGTGKVKINIQWTKFKERKIDKKVKRVYTQGMGYGITHEDVVAKNGTLMPFSKYGCSYDDWLKGEKPIPLKFLGCPYQETSQRLQSEDVNDLYKTRCKENLGFGLITNCKFFHDKQKCWEIYEKDSK